MEATVMMTMQIVVQVAKCFSAFIFSFISVPSWNAIFCPSVFDSGEYDESLSLISEASLKWWKALEIAAIPIKPKRVQN